MSENGVEVESWYVLTFSPKNIETDFIIFVPFLMLGFKYCLHEFAFKVTFIIIIVMTNITVVVKIYPIINIQKSCLV